MPGIIEASARSLFERLKPTGLIATVAVGSCKDAPALCVYTKKPADKRLCREYAFWEGFRVVWRRAQGGD